jgi:hypothetical protein
MQRSTPRDLIKSKMSKIKTKYECRKKKTKKDSLCQSLFCCYDKIPEKI